MGTEESSVEKSAKIQTISTGYLTLWFEPLTHDQEACVLSVLTESGRPIQLQENSNKNKYFI
jgi:hypothetical protein